MTPKRLAEEYDLVQHELRNDPGSGNDPELVAIVRPYGDVRLRVRITRDGWWRRTNSHQDRTASGRAELWTSGRGWVEVLTVTGLEGEPRHDYERHAVALVEQALKVVLT